MIAPARPAPAPTNLPTPDTNAPADVPSPKPRTPGEPQAPGVAPDMAPQGVSPDSLAARFAQILNQRVGAADAGQSGAPDNPSDNSDVWPDSSSHAGAAGVATGELDPLIGNQLPLTAIGPLPGHPTDRSLLAGGPGPLEEPVPVTVDAQTIANRAGGPAGLAKGRSPAGLPLSVGLDGSSALIALTPGTVDDSARLLVAGLSQSAGQDGADSLVRSGHSARVRRSGRRSSHGAGSG